MTHANHPDNECHHDSRLVGLPQFQYTAPCWTYSSPFFRRRISLSGWVVPSWYWHACITATSHELGSCYHIRGYIALVQGSRRPWMRLRSTNRSKYVPLCHQFRFAVLFKVLCDYYCPSNACWISVLERFQVDLACSIRARSGHYKLLTWTKRCEEDPEFG